ncbi:MAG: DUF4349 domain-containing protein [Pseudomonadota bacterium]|nr:DUF4349 domain-containing protein [Pseudomonadota bacterium]
MMITFKTSNALTVATLSTVLILSACSKPSEYASGDAVSESAASSVSATDMSRENIENPEQLVSDTQQQLEQSRQLVKSATVRFEVEDIQSTSAKIEQQLARHKGYIEARELRYQVNDYRRKNHKDGTVTIFEKIVPTTNITVRVPNAEVANFLNILPAMMKYFDAQSYEAKRYQLKLLEQRLNTADRANNVSEQTDRQLQQLTESEAKDRLQYSTIHLTYFQMPELRQRQDMNLDEVVAEHQDAFHHRIWYALQDGFEMFKALILWLFYIWPAYVVLLVIYVFVRVIRAKKQKANI